MTDIVEYTSTYNDDGTPKNLYDTEFSLFKVEGTEIIFYNFIADKFFKIDKDDVDTAVETVFGKGTFNPCPVDKRDDLKALLKKNSVEEMLQERQKTYEDHNKESNRDDEKKVATRRPWLNCLNKLLFNVDPSRRGYKYNRMVNRFRQSEEIEVEKVKEMRKFKFPSIAADPNNLTGWSGSGGAVSSEILSLLHLLEYRNNVNNNFKNNVLPTLKGGFFNLGGSNPPPSTDGTRMTKKDIVKGMGLNEVAETTDNNTIRISSTAFGEKAEALGKELDKKQELSNFEKMKVWFIGLIKYILYKILNAAKLSLVFGKTLKLEPDKSEQAKTKATPTAGPNTDPDSEEDSKQKGGARAAAQLMLKAVNSMMAVGTNKVLINIFDKIMSTSYTLWFIAPYMSFGTFVLLKMVHGVLTSYRETKKDFKKSQVGGSLGGSDPNDGWGAWLLKHLRDIKANIIDYGHWAWTKGVDFSTATWDYTKGAFNKITSGVGTAWGWVSEKSITLYTTFRALPMYQQIGIFLAFVTIMYGLYRYFRKTPQDQQSVAGLDAAGGDQLNDPEAFLKNLMTTKYSDIEWELANYITNTRNDIAIYNKLMKHADHAKQEELAVFIRKLARYVAKAVGMLEIIRKHPEILNYEGTGTDVREKIRNKIGRYGTKRDKTRKKVQERMTEVYINFLANYPFGL